jgi:hypothetical protein
VPGWAGKGLRTVLRLLVDDRSYEGEIAQHSFQLAQATNQQREHFVVSPAGYGIHWPDPDEDLSIDGLIGIKHRNPVLTRVS